MVRPVERCTRCGAVLEEPRRLVRGRSGAWMVVTMPLRCTNPGCRIRLEGSRPESSLRSMPEERGPVASEHARRARTRRLSLGLASRPKAHMGIV